MRIQTTASRGIEVQKPERPHPLNLTRRFGPVAMLLAGLLMDSRSALAASPWENAANALETAFTGPIARGLSLVAIVVGGLMFAFGEGDSKRQLAGIVFGVGMAISAVNFLTWITG